MSTQTRLSADFEAFAVEQVACGHYADVSEVLDAAKAALERERADDVLDVVYVRQAVQEGIASGTAEGDVLGRLRAKYDLPPGS